MDYKKISDFFKFHSKLIKNPICLGWDYIHQEGLEPPTNRVETCYSNPPELLVQTYKSIIPLLYQFFSLFGN